MCCRLVIFFSLYFSGWSEKSFIQSEFGFIHFEAHPHVESLLTDEDDLFSVNLAVSLTTSVEFHLCVNSLQFESYRRRIFFSLAFVDCLAYQDMEKFIRFS